MPKVSDTELRGDRLLAIQQPSADSRELSFYAERFRCDCANYKPGPRRSVEGGCDSRHLQFAATRFSCRQRFLLLGLESIELERKARDAEHDWIASITGHSHSTPAGKSSTLQRYNPLFPTSGRIDVPLRQEKATKVTRSTLLKRIAGRCERPIERALPVANRS